MNHSQILLAGILAVLDKESRRVLLIQLCDQWNIQPAVSGLPEDIEGDYYYKRVSYDYEETIHRLAQHAQSNPHADIVAKLDALANQARKLQKGDSDDKH